MSQTSSSTFTPSRQRGQHIKFKESLLITIRVSKY